MAVPEMKFLGWSKPHIIPFECLDERFDNPHTVVGSVPINWKVLMLF
jgi:hypothetical protein